MARSSLLRAAVGALAVLALVAGCGGSGSTATGTPPGGSATGTSSVAPAPASAAVASGASLCGLVSAAAARAVVGLPVGTGAVIPLEPGRTCRYATANGARKLDLFVRDASAYDTVAQAFGLTVAVAGLGDAALRDSDGTKLIARQGSIYVLILASSNVRDSQSTKALVAAESAIATTLLKAG